MPVSAARQREENLPEARLKLECAIHALIDPQIKLAGRPDCPQCHNQDCEPACTDHTCRGHTSLTSSLYMQLWDAAPSEQITGRRELSATAVTWTDALQLRMEIDLGVEIAQPAFTGVPPTVGRLREIAKRRWKPQQARYVEQLAKALEDWARDIQKLLYPEPNWTLAAACPNCGQNVAYGTDSGGQRVRKPALSIGPQGCTCGRCGTVWTPDRFLFLARVLGYKPPAGVVDTP